MTPNKEDFLAQTGGTRPMVVVRDVLSDIETPVSAYWKLAHDQEHSFLLESVTGGENVSRYSYIGIRPKAVLRAKNDVVRHLANGNWSESTLDAGKDPLHVLEAELFAEQPLVAQGLPEFTGGAVGMLSYDIVRHFERLPDSCEDPLNVDDMAMMLTDTVVAFDHAKKLLRILVTTDGSAESYDAASREADWVLSRLENPLPELPDVRQNHGSHPVESTLSKERYIEIVERVKQYIAEGDAIQVVPSQRLSTRVEAHPLTVYRALRTVNPSPYMFLLRFGDFDVVGASPELLVSLNGAKARVRPIAGTRWRGKTEEEDQALADELIADVKERAEHIMLVDLGRNDLGRVCEYGTVQVNDLMVIERYSHVMHIVSDVTGTLAKDKSAFDLFRACHPAGTVSGAPKVRAMQIIDEMEPVRRGLYAGAVGSFSYTGAMNTCIAIRTILLKGGMAYVQAGGGVVYDSLAESEYQESLNKARAALRAIELAQKGLDLG